MIESFNQSFTLSENLSHCCCTAAPNIWSEVLHFLKMFQSVQTQQPKTSHFWGCFVTSHPDFIMHRCLHQHNAPSFRTTPAPQLHVCLDRGASIKPPILSAPVMTLWDVHSFMCETGASFILLIPQPVCSPSRQPADYFHGEEKVCPRGRALVQAMTLHTLVDDHFLISEGGRLFWVWNYLQLWLWEHSLVSSLVSSHDCNLQSWDDNLRGNILPHPYGKCSPSIFLKHGLYLQKHGFAN